MWNDFIFRHLVSRMPLWLKLSQLRIMDRPNWSHSSSKRYIDWGVEYSQSSRWYGPSHNSTPLINNPYNDVIPPAQVDGGAPDLVHVSKDKVHPRRRQVSTFGLSNLSLLLLLPQVERLLHWHGGGGRQAAIREKQVSRELITLMPKPSEGRKGLGMRVFVL